MGARPLDATVLNLTLSVGATTAIFSVVDAVLLQPPSFSDPARLAMGAEPRHVVRMVVRGAIGLAGAGVLTGLVASLLVSRSLNSLLVDVAPFDAATLAGVSVLLFLVAAGAAHVPARRAARVDPLAALRMD